MTKAEEDVLAERAKQRAKWGDHHDDAVEVNGELPTAGAYLAHPEHDPCFEAPTWAVSLKERKDRRQQLVCAAALAIAEIDRMDRQ